MRRVAVFVLLLLFVCLAGLASWWGGTETERALSEELERARTSAGIYPDLAIAVDGRFVTLAGTVESEQARSDAIALIDGVRGHLDIDAAAIEILPSRSPYVFSVTKSLDGRVSITGVAPNEAARQRILLRAQELYDADAMTARIELAAGMPDQDWLLMVDRGMETVSQLVEATAELSDQNLSIVGTAENKEFEQRVVTTVQRELPEQYRNRGKLDIGSLAPLYDPYIFEIEKTETSLSFRGVVPNEATARSIIGQAAELNPGLQVSSQLVEGRGVPANSWPSDVVTASGLLQNVDEGRVLFEGRKLLVEGRASSPEALLSLEQTVQQLSGYEVARNLSLPVPQPQDTTDTESGRSAEVGAPTSSGPVAGERGTAPDDGSVFEPELWFDGQTQTVNGFEIPTLVAKPSDSACERWFVWRQREESILFATGSADVAPESEALLNEILAVLSACMEAGENGASRGVRVLGHTDSTGSADGNKALSEQRAKSVVEALVLRGLEREHLIARGLGGEVPIASNETEEGRAKNRRIEFELYER